LSLAFQPEVDLQTREVLAVEALLRWHHPEHGQVAPDEFIALAERSDLISTLGAWVVDDSIRALARWRRAVPDLDVVLRVNVSPLQLKSSGLVELFDETLRANSVPGRLVCVELTENAPLTDPEQVASTLRRLKDLGITSAIDDLATGYSTLSQLRWLPVDAIKLDRSLVTGIDTDARAEAIVTALIGLAISFGLDVVAEGVETEAEAQTLLRLGCFRAQGHHLGRPAPEPEVLALLKQRGRTVAGNL
jgi:EAL domain-containing protein (putative c-di-GMP-specific phosphodiesterase class I)